MGGASARIDRVRLWRNAKPDERDDRSCANGSGFCRPRKTTRSREGPTTKWERRTDNLHYAVGIEL